MATLQVLVVDDEPAIRQVLASQVAKAGHHVALADRGSTALERLMRGDIDIAVCDVRIPDFDGIELVRRCRALKIETHFIMVSAFSSLDTAIEAMRAGAFDYVVKPLVQDDVIRRLDQVANLIGLRAENQRLRQMVQGAGEQECLRTSRAMTELYQLAARVAKRDSTVLITGESGTGKGVLAKSMHSMSPRASFPMLSVNCGAIPENLLESEFFGHLKGSFTGADRAKKGFFLEADGGTLFLDEITELPLNLQVKLLNALEAGEVRPVGAETPRKVNVRILAATNRNVEKMVAEGRFREDLFYRLNVMHLHIPPLREVPEDIPGLYEYFIGRESRKIGAQELIQVDPTVDEILREFEWPGNVRQLQNVIERAVILADGSTITLGDLPADITRARGTNGGEMDESPAGQGLREQVKQFEVKLITRAIEEAGGDRAAAARRLGIGLSTLYRKLDEGTDMGGLIDS